MPSQKTGKEILSHIKTSYPINTRNNYPEFNKFLNFVGSDYGWNWSINDPTFNNQTMIGNAFDYDSTSTLSNNSIDIEITSRDGLHKSNSTYIVKIYPNRMRNLRLRCQELLKVLSNNGLINGQACAKSPYEPGASNVTSSAWAFTNLPGGNNKIWKKPDLGSIPVLQSLYKNITNRPQVKIQYPVNNKTSMIYDSKLNSKFSLNPIADSVHPISQIERYSPKSVIENKWIYDTMGSGLQIEMYIKSIVEKTEKVNIAQYFGKNIVLSAFYDHVFGEELIKFVKGISQSFYEYDSIVYQPNYLARFNTFVSDYKYALSRVDWPRAFDKCPGKWKATLDISNIFSAITSDMFFEKYINDDNYTARDVDTIEYWELELIDPTEVFSTPSVIPDSSSTSSPVSPTAQSTSGSTKTVNPLLTSSVVPFDGSGRIPFEGYFSTTSATYVIDADVNNSITLYDRKDNRSWKRCLGSYAGELIIKSVPTTVNNKTYNINTVALVYTLNDSIKFGGTNDSLLLKEGIVPFGYGSRVEINSLKLPSSPTDPNGLFFKYTDYNGRAQSISLRTLLNNTYVHYVTRYYDYDNIKNVILYKEMIVLSQRKPDISILPAYLDLNIKQTYGFDMQSIAFSVINVVREKRVNISGWNPFSDIMFLNNRRYLDGVARYLGANYGDNVKLTIFPVGKATDLIRSQFPTLSGTGTRDKNDNLITPINFNATKNPIMWYVDMEILQPNLRNLLPL